MQAVTGLVTVSVTTSTNGYSFSSNHFLGAKNFRKAREALVLLHSYYIYIIYIIYIIYMVTGLPLFLTPYIREEKKTCSGNFICFFSRIYMSLMIWAVNLYFCNRASGDSVLGLTDIYNCCFNGIVFRHIHVSIIRLGTI